ncbi:NIF3-like protein 1 like protein [Argiope bruennichi]|uniref:NIF3-like protein 1 n=1 Tax=Argiope bruennichi TaxID=94029 RepID=A0A8T0E516_ARGBR|nr:NIF3-like protein 1 like protein [Argiope bruennichi]
MDLSNIIKSFETLVPKHLAEKWDNTGLLVEPLQNAIVSTIFFTNDLTENVLKEALAVGANLIISYHPPLFTAFKTLGCENWKDRIIMTCIANNIAIYSPHTACDAVEGGVNDWLLKCFDLTNVSPIKQSADVNSHIIECITLGDISFDSLLDRGAEFEVLLTSCYGDKKCFKILTNSKYSAMVSQILLANSAVLTVNSNQCTQLIHSEVLLN